MVVPSTSTLSLLETAHRLRMHVSLVQWLTRHAPKPGSRAKLALATPTPTFLEQDVEAFNTFLWSQWATRQIPAEIQRELEREARAHCGLCRRASDVMEAAHIDRLGVERPDYCQHPHNLILLCRECHGRYDRRLVENHIIKHAKRQLLNALMADVDRDIALEAEMRRISERAAALTRASVASKLVLVATGHNAQFVTDRDAVEGLIIAAAATKEHAPYAAAHLVGTALAEGGEDVDSWEALDQVREPLPSTREEFDAVFPSHKDDDDPDHALYAWAVSAGATFRCKWCSALCISVDDFSAALADEWQRHREEEGMDEGEHGASGESVDETWDQDREHVASMVLNVGVETGGFGAAGFCSYHADQDAKDRARHGDDD